MRPASHAKIDHVAFQKMKRIAPNQLEARGRHGFDDWRARELPEEVAFKLTNRCNLRCAHCYQWNEQGYHHAMAPTEQTCDLDLRIVEKVLAATQPIKSNLFVWGGEPLVYRDWEALIDLFEWADRWTSICTNGMLIGHRLDSLLRISRRLEMFVAIDGLEDEHDALRGRGTFTKTLEGVRLLLAAKKAGEYLGEITVNCVIQDSMIEKLFDFVSFLQSEDVDGVYISFPWFISEQTAQMMDMYVKEHLSWMSDLGQGSGASWHSYTFRIDTAALERLNAEIQRINSENWRIKVRYNPTLDYPEMKEFLLGSHRPAQNKTRCLALSSRADVYPPANVVSCHLFPELSVGDLTKAEFNDIWHGTRYNQIRQTVAECGLMPVCAKCNLLYTRGM
jgi:MoaA/NifB/PqqE/SkfB family radical SAM enzyme